MPASPTDLDRLLAKARLDTPPYTEREVAAAEARLSARVADRVLHGALSFDAAIQARVEAALGRDRTTGERGEPAEQRRMHDAAQDLQRLCALVVAEPEALHQMSAFIGGGRLLEPDGARVLACVLQLAGREDSARFWWQYAAGAGDTSSAYCLYLHHLSLAEVGEAHWWHAHADPDRPARTRPSADAYDLVISWAVSLEVARGFAPPPTRTTAAAVLGYVSKAIQFTDNPDLDLPLPPVGFAERITQLTTSKHG
ncbi:hypothetical protein [Streptomyces rimosus]|uniref:hypothetical protein n=1 Tax=Streptomyces rimosus TaxID=1927 RepID=UPI0004C8287D|nr:hypothetical protein [Streptomyces rimosus]